jgi:hypothetical protein
VLVCPCDWDDLAVVIFHFSNIVTSSVIILGVTETVSVISFSVLLVQPAVGSWGVLHVNITLHERSKEQR